MDDMTEADIAAAREQSTAPEPAEARASSAGRQSEPAAPTRAGRRARMFKLRYALFALGALVLIVGGLCYWLSGGRYVTTDDAYVRPTCSTCVHRCLRHRRQIRCTKASTSQAGQVLFRLDPNKFQIALDNARANLGQTRLDLQVAAGGLPARPAPGRGAAGAGAGRSGHLRPLRRAGAPQRGITPAISTTRNTSSRPTRPRSAPASAQVTAALARLGGTADMPMAQMPAYRQAAARLAEAEREFDHAIVRAAVRRRRHPGQQAAARPVPRRRHRGFRPDRYGRHVGRRGAEGDGADLCPPRPDGHGDDRCLSGPRLARHGAERGTAPPTRNSPCCRRRIRPATG